jgi:hypothetical protein
VSKSHEAVYMFWNDRKLHTFIKKIVSLVLWNFQKLQIQHTKGRCC